MMVGEENTKIITDVKGPGHGLFEDRLGDSGQFQLREGAR